MARTVPFNATHSVASVTQRGASSRLSADTSRKLAGLMLSAALAAVLVVADQLIDTWTDGHLLAGWIVLWAVVFAALALLVRPLRQLSNRLSVAVADALRAAQQRRADEETWAYAQQDPRLVSELRYASVRDAA